LTAHGLVRDLVLQADRLDPGAEVDDQLITLLAGDSHTFRVTTSLAADDPRWARGPVLMSVNDLAHVRRSVGRQPAPRMGRWGGWLGSPRRLTVRAFKGAEDGARVGGRARDAARRSARGEGRRGRGRGVGGGVRPRASLRGWDMGEKPLWIKEFSLVHTGGNR
jgi:hypothetical protein